MAPPGGEALYVLVHTPYLRPHHDWSQMLPAYRNRIIRKLVETAGMKDLEQHIVVERALTPQDINDRYHVLDGAIYGLASHGRFLGAFKPANRSPDVEGLYLAGGSAHPGPGHADGADVGLDRGRLRRRGQARRPGESRRRRGVTPPRSRRCRSPGPGPSPCTARPHTA